MNLYMIWPIIWFDLI